MKRKIVLYTHFYGDARFMTNILYRPALDECYISKEEEWLYNEGPIIIDRNDDVIYYIYKK